METFQKIYRPEIYNANPESLINQAWNTKIIHLLEWPWRT